MDNGKLAVEVTPQIRYVADYIHYYAGLADKVQGDVSLFHKLVDGDWPEADFLIVRPGEKVVATFDEKIIGVAPV